MLNQLKTVGYESELGFVFFFFFLSLFTVSTGSFECRYDDTGNAQDLLRHQADTSLSPTRGLLDLSALVRSLQNPSIC